ncbi:hypothetical protein ACFLS7_00575 [Bacteroidota bacterium]
MKKIKNLGGLVGFAFIGLCVMLSAQSAQAQTMSVNPFKINLNAQGAADNIQCAYPGFLASTNITGQDVQICFAGDYVADAYNVEYCPVDNMIFVQYDWTTMISSSVLTALADTGQVVVTITGSFSVTTNTGAVIVYDVNRWGYAEVIKPGNRK